MPLRKVLETYGLKSDAYLTEEFGNGLIHSTWKITHKADRKEFILQRINTSVFSSPEAIAQNIRNISNYLKQRYPGYRFISPLENIYGTDLYADDDGSYYRLFPFVEGSHSINVIETPSQAFEAAKQFAIFTRLLSEFDLKKLNVTISGFHDLSLRYRHFEAALTNGNKERIREASHLIAYLLEQNHIAHTYTKIVKDPAFKLRVTHHDTKISNVLFSKNNKGLCVVDLDTVMPGYFISDAGDMMRTYLSPADEEETDFGRITIREEIFEGIIHGYFSEMKDHLSASEKSHFVYAGKFMIFMQSLRFLSDYLNNDIYYGAKYEKHNFNRAANQAVLLNKFQEKENILNRIVEAYVA